MRKVEVLNDCILAVKKGSVVFVDDRQFETARRVLKPVEVKKETETETAERPKKRKKAETE